MSAAPDYVAFLAGKRRLWTGQGVAVAETDLPAELFPFQRALVRWALKKGRAALWSDTGTGKTAMQLAWAAHVPGRVLILAPLCVAGQTIAEGRKFGIPIGRHGEGERIEITNYEQLHRVRAADYTGIVLDESSILKAFDGKTRTALIRAFADTPWRLCCTATPAPNDLAELANHAEFLGVMTRAEMLATFFVHDDQGWRLRGHAAPAFYRWLASWGCFLKRPSDLGFSDAGFALPALSIEALTVSSPAPSETLFPEHTNPGLKGALRARRDSVAARVDATAALVADGEPWIIWCGLDAEQHAILKALDGDAVSVSGKDSLADKEARLRAFCEGSVRVLVTKPTVAGFGLNLQHCARMAFVGLGYSYEQYYQAIRRCWRFGQRHPVRAVVVVSPAEGAVVAAVQRKEAEAERLSRELIGAMRAAEREEVGVTERTTEAIETATVEGAGWRLALGDSVDRMREWPENALGLSVHSPPFLALYTYTNSEHDLGNSSSREEFLTHYGYIVRELLRATAPGRLACVHVMQVPTTKVTHGVIGLEDFRAQIVRLYVDAGWIYHGEVVIDKNPQAQAIRTHAKGLLFAQLRRDASWLRPALADYILVFRKPGDNAIPIQPDLSNEEWIEWAHPVWYGIRETDTLNVASARGAEDDRHICPLQLGTIERCIRLWSNPGDLVADPFAGLGSTGYVAIQKGRHFTGCELKRTYFDAAVRNLRRAEREIHGQLSLGHDELGASLPADGTALWAARLGQGGATSGISDKLANATEARL